MNGSQAHMIQIIMPLYHPHFLPDWAAVSDREWELWTELWEEFWPDAGNLFRIPMMVREYD